MMIRLCLRQLLKRPERRRPGYRVQIFVFRPVGHKVLTTELERATAPHFYHQGEENEILISEGARVEATPKARGVCSFVVPGLCR